MTIMVVYFLSYLFMFTPPKTELLLDTFREEKDPFPPCATGGHLVAWPVLGVQVERVVKLSRAMAMERAKAIKAKVKLKAPAERGDFIMGILIRVPTFPNHLWFI